MISTFDHALATARQLAPRDRARLVARIVEELVEAPAQIEPADAWATMERLRREFAELPRPAGTLAEQAERDRNEREAMLIGRGADDVHA